MPAPDPEAGAPEGALSVMEPDAHGSGAAIDAASRTENGGVSMPAQVARASSWGLAGRSLLLLANFAATPFTIRLLGPAGYGLWALLLAVFTWANVAEGGMGTATTKYASECYAHGDVGGEVTVIWSGISFAIVTTSAAAIALALKAPFLLSLLHVRGPMLSSGTWALRLLCAGFVLGALSWTVGTVQQVRLRWKQFTIFNAVSNLVGCVGVPIAIYLFAGGVMAAAAASVLAPALYLLGLTWEGVRVLPALRRPRINRATLRRLVTYGGVLTIANFVGIPLLTAERFILGHNASTTAVAYYAVAATVATTLCIIPEQLTQPLMPALARLESEGKAAAHKALYGKALSGIFLLVTPATVLLALVARPFLTLWAGPAYGAHSTLPLIVALVGVWAWAHGWVAKSYMLSAARVKWLAWIHLVELPFYLGAAWVATARWGALGAALVWSARLVVDTIVRFFVVHRWAGLPWLPLATRRLRALAAPVLLAAACLAAATVTGGLPARTGAAAGLAVVYGAAVWWGVLTPKERQGLSALAAESVSRRLPQRERSASHAGPPHAVGARPALVERSDSPDTTGALP